MSDKRKPTTRPSSYDPDAWLPGAGSVWVWEIDSLGACKLIDVVDVFWNGETWWVRTKVRQGFELPEALGGAVTHLNDISRFWEACTPVRATQTPRPSLDYRPEGFGDES